MTENSSEPRLLTAAELLDRGYSRRDRERAERQRRLRRVRHGVYTFGAGPPGGPAAEESLLEMRSRAAARHISPGTALSHVSALVMHGLPIYDLDTGRVTTTRHRPGSGSRRGELTVCHNSDLTDARVEVDGIPVTSPARTIVDVARSGSFDGALCAADEALRRGLCLPEDLATQIACAAGRTGVARARAVVDFADHRAESVLESLSRIAIGRAGLPMPELQVEIVLPTGRTARVDMYWEEWRLVGECDGLAKYGVDAGEATVRRRLRDEKSRQNGLESRGRAVRRWNWWDVQQNRVEGIVREALRIQERAGYGPGRVA